MYKYMDMILEKIQDCMVWKRAFHTNLHAKLTSFNIWIAEKAGTIQYLVFLLPVNWNSERKNAPFTRFTFQLYISSNHSCKFFCNI